MTTDTKTVDVDGVEWTRGPEGMWTHSETRRETKSLLARHSLALDALHAARQELKEAWDAAAEWELEAIENAAGEEHALDQFTAVTLERDSLRAKVPADHERFVRVSPELVAQLQAAPTDPVRFQIEEREGGELFFILTRADYIEPPPPNATVPPRYMVRVPHTARVNHPRGLYWLAPDMGLTADKGEAHVYHGHDCPAVRDGRPIDHVVLEAVT